MHVRDNSFRKYTDLTRHCSGWRVLAPERFLGSLDVLTLLSKVGTKRLAGPFAGNTSNPILFIGNTAGQFILPFQSLASADSGRFRSRHPVVVVCHVFLLLEMMLNETTPQSS